MRGCMGEGGGVGIREMSQCVVRVYYHFLNKIVEVK